MSSSYERIRRALLILFEAPGSLQERLADAYRSELQYLGPEGLDEARLYELENINDQLTRIEASGDRDAIEMSAQALSDFEAQELVAQIKDIYEYLARSPRR